MYSVARFVEEAARRRHWEVAPEVPQELRSAVPESAVDVASLGGDSGTLADDDGETDDVSELDSEVSADEKWVAGRGHQPDGSGCTVCGSIRGSVFSKSQVI